MSIKVVSFDLDGTLIDDNFINNIWFKELPKLVSTINQIPFHKAKKIVVSEYDKIGENRLEWYNLEYWLKKFNLEINAKDLLNKVRDTVRIYPDAVEILNKLFKKYILILNTNSPREFMEIELTEANIKKFFHYTFSATSDFKQVKKNKEYYIKICNIINIDPKNILHVGDNLQFDYRVPSEIGINTVFLDRESREQKVHTYNTIKNLNELEKYILKKK